jgi:predicted aspartyl protease
MSVCGLERENPGQCWRQASYIADDYVLARKENPDRGETRKCHSCGKIGHIAKYCKTKPAGQPQGRDVPRCYNCHQRGHIASKCPSAVAMFQEEANRRAERVLRKGMIEGQIVDDILLDTGSAITMIQEGLVPSEKFTGRRTMVRCAHGDEITYPVASVELEVEGSKLSVLSAVSKKLPVSALLGRDISQLFFFLGQQSEA